MYFLEQIKGQFMKSLTLWVSWPDWAIAEVREQSNDGTKETEWPKSPDDVIALARQVNAKNNRAVEDAVATGLMEKWDQWNDTLVWDDKSDILIAALWERITVYLKWVSS